MAQVQAVGVDNGAGGTSLVGTVASTAAASGLILIFFTTSNQTVVTVTDNKSQTWLVKATGGKLHCAIFPNSASAVTTVTTTLPISDNAIGFFIERNDVLGTDFYDTNSGAQTSQSGVTTFTSTTTGTPAQANSLAVGVAGSTTGAAQFDGSAPGNSFTNLAGTSLTNGVHDGGGVAGYCLTKTITSAAAQTASGQCVVGANPFSRCFLFAMVASGGGGSGAGPIYRKSNHLRRSGH